MIKEVQRLEEARRDLIKEIYTVFEDFFEKIFKRKELQKFKTQADLLEKEVDLTTKTLEEKKREIEAGERLLRMLYSGDTVRLTYPEKVMILNAIEYVNFKNMIELPDTKAHVRITYRGPREKIKLHLKEAPVVEKMDITPEIEPEVKGVSDG